jgi:hypothetical protein
MAREQTSEGVDDETKFRLCDRTKLNIAPLLGHMEGTSCWIQTFVYEIVFCFKLWAKALLLVITLKMGDKNKKWVGENNGVFFTKVYIVSFYEICLELLFMWVYTFEK